MHYVPICLDKRYNIIKKHVMSMQGKIYAMYNEIYTSYVN